MGISLFAQNINTWKGGTPGKENKWDEPRNWSKNQVPDEFSDVIIPDVSTSTFSYPIIEEAIIELNSIMVQSTANLTIESTATLVIYDDPDGLAFNNINVKESIIAANDNVWGAAEKL